MIRLKSALRHLETRKIWILAILLLFPLSISAQTDILRGRVIGVADGDTITVLGASRQEHKIRLNGIDAPESGQDFGQVSKHNLSNLVFGKDVAVIWRKRDRYDRIVGKVMVGSTDINLEQLRAGLAWYFRKYASDVLVEDRGIYDQAEREAQSDRRGLWQQPNPQSPWEYRARERGETVPNEEISWPSRGAGQIVGNRNSMIYHRPNCPDYQKVSEWNRIYFASEQEAEKAGFRRARNCP